VKRAKAKAPDELCNVTLTLRADLLRRARHVAVERGLSLSRLLAEELEKLVGKDEEYEAAQKRLLARMRKGFNLGLKDGRVPWTRDEIHER
jgi:hypothetical protein